MFHLLDGEQTVLDDFNAFGPGAGDEGVQEEQEEVSPAATRERLKGVTAAATKQGKGAEGKVKGGDSKKAVGAGTQRGKAGITVAEGMDKEEMRRLGLYAAFLLPLADSMCPNQKRANVS